MEFKRRFRVSRVFECVSGEGDFSFVRPSGFNTTRKALDLSCEGREFEVRTEKDQVWLLDGDETVAFGAGEHNRWKLVIADKNYVLDQQKFGVNLSTVEKPGGKVVAQIRGIGFPISRIELINQNEFSVDAQVFIAMIATLSWREGDRHMMGAGGSSGDGGG